MRRVWKTVLLGTFTSLFMGVWFYLALRNKYHTWDQLNLVNTALWAVVAGFSATAAWLFLQGVQNFRPQLRHAYRLLCIGLIIFGIAQVQYPVASYIHAEFWYLGGFIAIPYLAAAVYMFWGVRSFASLVELRSHWMSWW
ncbi:MAG TPA: hypothetical protein VHQ86_04365, partial [Candidatus Saccharimonadia bacterium]|nr:hypothetical protein [Candidatus Saccharimonadia bacterium]